MRAWLYCRRRSGVARREEEAVVVAAAGNDSDLVNCCERGICLCVAEVEGVCPPFCSDPADVVVVAAAAATDVVAAYAGDGVQGG